jgi:hypothetical protein
MARTARLKKFAGSPATRPAPSVGRDIAYHGDVAGHQRILEALGAVPELSSAVPGASTMDDARADKWPAIKTFFFVMVFCSTAWATISAAVLFAFR